jgi:hypothetical protein
MSTAIAFDDAPKDFGQFDVSKLDAVTLVDGDKALLQMTDVNGMRIAIVLGIGDLFAATYVIGEQFGREILPGHPLPTVN